MAAPTPIHRDPESDGDDYGCIGANAQQGNKAVAEFVSEVRSQLKAGMVTDVEELVYGVRTRLEQINNQHECGSCDTIVKENVFAALHDAVERAGIDAVDQMEIYGW